jgi:DNA-binding transcriptional LysR family regulator
MALADCDLATTSPLIAPALPGLLRRYPRLEIGLGSTDRSIDLVQEGVDGGAWV